MRYWFWKTEASESRDAVNALQRDFVIGRSGGATEYTEDTEIGTETKFNFLSLRYFSVQPSVSSVFSVALLNLTAQCRTVVLNE